MGLIRDFIDYRKSKKAPQPNRDERIAEETRSIIREYYGNNANLFVWNYAQQIYNITEVRTAIETIAKVFSIMPIYHKKVDANGNVVKITKMSDDINYVLGLKPNPLDNSISFWQSCINQLLLHNNLFIEPEYDMEGKLSALYPLPFTVFDFNLNNGKAFVRFYQEKNGAVVEKHNLDNLIYIKRFCSLNGGQKNDLGLYETVLQALNNKILKICDPNKVKALISSKTPEGQLKEKDKKGVAKTIQTSFDSNVKGIAYIDEKWQITPVNWEENDVNRDLMKLVIDTVYKYFGINDKIIGNEANEFQMETFIETTIKPLADQFEQELTTKLFTKREIEFGHKVEFDVFNLSVNTLQAKVSFFSIASRNGIANIDEMRAMVGLPPLPNGYGQKYRVSADCVDIEIADKYQLGKYGLDNKTTEETVSTTENVSHETFEKVEDIENEKKEESNARDSKEK